MARLATVLRLCLRSSVLAITVALALAGSAVGARVPQGFVGMNANDPLFDPNLDLSGQLDRMVAGGVESLRVVFNWSAAQPYRSWSDVPPAQVGEFENVGGVPTNFAATDVLARQAAQRGLQLLPTVMYTPGWDAARHPANSFAPPASDAPYASFVSALVHRYGPNGSYWQQGAVPYRPIHMWQIWNEPNTSTRWPIQPFAKSYVALVRAAHAAIKRADRGAEVVLAGMPNYSWTDLTQIYRIPGARKVFDVVAVHPYTADPAGVIQLLRLNRKVMARFGDAHKPMLATEAGWPSSLGRAPEHYPFATTEAGQAAKLAALLPMLASHRAELGLLGFYYYTWLGSDSGHAFSFAGLFKLRGDQIVAKPAFGAFRHAALKLEACRVKAAVSTRCLKSG